LVISQIYYDTDNKFNQKNMRYLLIALLFISCQKDGIFEKQPPILTIEVQFSIPYTSQVILTGNVSEVCYRGCVVPAVNLTFRPLSIMILLNVLLPVMSKFPVWDPEN